jgi:peptidoglycan/LPS O-acetylase OafA/YrhL
MGLLRTIYALTVVLYHAWPASSLFVGGENAVRCFYIISGFLISYILVERKSYPSLRTFYVNRYLRLYPIYVCVAVPTLILILASGRFGFMEVYKAAPPAADLLLVLSNLVMFGQDWLMFLGVRDDHLVFVTNFLKSDVLLYRGQIIHPAWTLGVELSFYLIAPFILPRRKWIYGLLALSLALRLLFIYLGFGTRDPWTYRFFPTELALFLVGALAHQVLLPQYRKLGDRIQKSAANGATWFLVAFSLVYFLIPVEEAVKRLILLFVFACGVPLTFLFQRRYALDGWIGNLSYPIYISHLPVIWACNFLSKRAGLADARLVAVICVVSTVVLAILLNQWVAVPFEKLRSRVRAQSAPRTRLSANI